MTEPARLGASTLFPVSLTTVKQHLAIDDDDWDELLAEYIAAAVNKVEALSGRAIASTDWTWSLDGFPVGDIVLPFGPVAEGVVISFFDGQDVAGTLSSGAYIVDRSQVEARIRAVDGWPQTSARLASVTITWASAPEVCPPVLKQAVLMLVDHWFANRNGTVEGDGGMPRAVRELIATQKRFRG